jgi:hypothetical protein
MVSSDSSSCGMDFEMIETSFCVQKISHVIENREQEDNSL